MRFVSLSDSDSYLKWGASLRTALPPGADFRQVLVESSVAPSAAQQAAALAVSGVDPAELVRVGVRDVPALLAGLRPDVVLVAMRGPAAALTIGLANQAPGRPVIVSGLPGISIPATRLALLFRRHPDLFLLHSRREIRDFTALSRSHGWDHRFGLATLPFVERRPASAGTDLVFAVQAVVPRESAERRRVARLLIDAALAEPDKRVVVKLRAAEGERQTHDEHDSYPALLAALGPLPPNLVLSTEPMSAALDRAEGLVTVSSTAAIEAIARGIPVIVLDTFGVSDDLINVVFEGSGLLAGEAAVIGREFRHPEPSWLDDNYFHPAEAADWLQQLDELLVARAAGELPPREIPRVWGGPLRAAWSRQRAFGPERTASGLVARALGDPARVIVRTARRLRGRGLRGGALKNEAALPG